MPVLFPPFVRERGDDVSRRLHSFGVRSPRLDEMWRAYGSLADSPNRAAFLRTLRSVIDPGGQVVSAMDRIYLASGLPTMIVWGDRDEIIPVEHAYAAHEAIAGSRLEIFEGAGHFPHAEEPARFVQVLSDFVATTEAGAHGPEHYRALLVTHGPAVVEAETL